MKNNRIILTALTLFLLSLFCMCACIGISAETAPEQIEVSGVAFPEAGKQATASNIKISIDDSISISNIRWVEWSPQSFNTTDFSGTFLRNGYYGLSFDITSDTKPITESPIDLSSLIINGKDSNTYNNVIYGMAGRRIVKGWNYTIRFYALKEVIKTVYLSYELPKIGESLNAIRISVPSGACYSAKANWEHNRGLEFSEDEIIAAGVSWYLSFILTPNEGYEFNDNTKLIINGTEHSHERYYDDASIISERKSISFFHKIESLNITSPTLECGESFGSFTVTSYSPAESGCTVDYTTWTYNEINDFNSSERYYAPADGGHYYWAEFKISTDHRYGFTKDTVITVNGGTATVSVSDLGYATIVVAFDPLVDTREVLKSVDIKLPTPYVGDTINIFGPYLKGTYYTISSMEIAESEVDDIFKSTELNHQNTFTKGMYCYIGIDLDVAKGYKFSQDTVVTMNGQQQMEITYDDGFNDGQGRITSTTYYAIFSLGKIGDKPTNQESAEAITTAIPDESTAPDETTAPNETAATDETTVPNDDTSSTDTEASTGTAASPEVSNPGISDTTVSTADIDSDALNSDVDIDQNSNEGKVNTAAIIITVVVTAIAVVAVTAIVLFKKRAHR